MKTFFLLALAIPLQYDAIKAQVTDSTVHHLSEVIINENAFKFRLEVKIATSMF